MRRSLAIYLAPLLVLAWLAPAEAGPFHRRRCRPAPRVCVTENFRVEPKVFAYPSVALAVTSQATDPAGFVTWLNGYRASAGVAPVAWDSALAGDAAHNSAMGFNHWPGTNRGRQNVGVGNLGAVSAAWMASPAHASALLDPRVGAVGLANVGGVWTFNAR